MQADFAATREQIRELDRIAIEEYGVPGVILMENAGRWCARTADRMLEGARGKTVTTVCGKGNNGGDGFVVARHLANWGAEVSVLLLGRAEEVAEDGGEAAVNLRIALKMGLAVRELETQPDVAEALRGHAETHLLVDALLGTGLTSEVRQPYRTAIERINAAPAPVLSVDVPSGLNCNTGRALGVAVRADRTVTFALRKQGFDRPGAEAHTGRVEVAEISVPRAAIERKLAEWTSEKQ